MQLSRLFILLAVLLALTALMADTAYAASADADADVDADADADEADEGADDALQEGEEGNEAEGGNEAEEGDEEDPTAGEVPDVEDEGEEDIDPDVSPDAELDFDVPEAEGLIKMSLEERAQLPGHLQPLGSHRSAEDPVFELNGFGDGKEFFEYVQKQAPVIIRRAVKGWPAFSKWTDEYLTEVAGENEVEVEFAKKEDRTGNGETTTLGAFLETYDGPDGSYLVQELDNNLKVDAWLPEGYRRIAFLARPPVMWMSSGDTSSVLHNDGDDNINCVVDGIKKVILVDQRLSDEVYDTEDHEGYGSRSPVDVDAVDMTMYPLMQRVKWHNITLYPGDCCYMPLGWFHAVKTPPGRSIAVNVWFQPAIEPDFSGDNLNDELSFVDKKWNWYDEGGDDGEEYNNLATFEKLLHRDNLYAEYLDEKGLPEQPAPWAKSEL